MPSESFYAGLTLAEQVQKFLDHHSDPRTRHISAYEAQMLDRAKARIEQTIEIAKDEAAAELQSAFEALLQVYETVIASEALVLAVNTFPTWHLGDPVEILARSGLESLVTDPTPVEVQAAVAALVTAGPLDTTVGNRYRTLNEDRRLVDRELDAVTLSVVNRLLYMPAVVAENSWAEVAPLLDHLSNAKSKGASVVVFGGTLVGTKGDLLLAILAGGSVIGLQLLQNVAEGMAPGLRALGAKLTSGWAASRPATKEE